MILIDYPKPDFNIKIIDGRHYVFDPIRKKWLVLEDEEWVRQNLVQYLIQVLQYPPTLIALEKEIKLGSLKKRFDVLVYDKQHQPWMLVECKAPSVPLRDAVLEQALRYNIVLPAKYLLIVNGKNALGWVKQAGNLIPIDSLPEFGADH